MYVTLVVENSKCFPFEVLLLGKVTVSKHNIRAIIKQYLSFYGTWWRSIDITSAFLGSNPVFIWNVHTKSQLILDPRGIGFRDETNWNFFLLSHSSVASTCIAILISLMSMMHHLKGLDTEQTDCQTRVGVIKQSCVYKILETVLIISGLSKLYH